MSIGSNDGSELQHILKTAIPTGNIVVNVVKGAVILTGEVDSAEDAKKAYDIATGFTTPDSSSGGGSGGGDNSQSSGQTTSAPGGATNSQYTSTINFAPTVQKGDQVINSLTIRGKDQVMLKVTVAEVQRQIMKQLGITSSSATGSWGRHFTQAKRFAAQFARTLTTGSTSVWEPQQCWHRYRTFVSDLDRFRARWSGPRARRADRHRRLRRKREIHGRRRNPGSAKRDMSAAHHACESMPSECHLQAIWGDAELHARRPLRGQHPSLHVSTEVTEIDPQQSFQLLLGVNIPGFRTRKNRDLHRACLQEGSIVLSPGLLQVQSQPKLSMDFLGLDESSPILGQMFRSRDYQRQETELMIIVTPYLAQPVTASQIPLPTDGFAPGYFLDPQDELCSAVSIEFTLPPNNPDLIKGYKGRVGFIND